MAIILKCYYEQFHILVKKFSPGIICLQETNFKKNHQRLLKYYNTYVKNRANENYASRGVAIVISDNYDFIEIPLNSNLEPVTVAILFPKKSTFAMSTFQIVFLLIYKTLKI